MSLRQNLGTVVVKETKLSYQSECHCAKTDEEDKDRNVKLSYQSECHCAKT